MDNLESNNSHSEDIIEPIPFDDDDTGKLDISHSPLNLGSSGTVEAKTPKIEVARPAEKKTENIVSSEQITGVKTFFAKLHPGAMEFLDEQITKWLKENPGVIVKQTDMTTGEIQGKKTEPNIIITVWY